MELFLPFLSFSFLLLLLLLSSQAQAQAQPTSAPAGTIERTTKQQVITSIPPGPPAASPGEPFLTSPSGRYAAYFLRAETAPGAGGFGNDFCYIQIRDSSSAAGESAWESECAPVGTANACALVFSDDGLAVFDGSDPQWDSSAESADSNPLETLELVDEGDMRLRDKIGELAWKASEDPRANQRCGEKGSAGLAPAMPPFAEPIGGTNMPFGQQGTGSGSARQEEGQVVPADGAGGTTTSSFGQPLGDSSPFGSGSLRTVGAAWVGMALAVTLMVYGFGY